MEFPGILGALSRTVILIVQIAYLNLLWILFSMIGMLFLGVAPATAAMFIVTRKWAGGNIDIPIFQTFWKSYRSNFIKSNIIFYILLIFGSLLYFYALMIQTLNGTAYYLISTLFISGLIPYLIIVLYIFPVIAHYDVGILSYIKYALLIGISSPLKTLLLAVNLIVCLIMSILFPPLIPFFPVALFSLVSMWIAMHTFNKMDG